MHLVFSWFANSGASPEHPGTGAAVIDQEVVGPLRLLDHVETMLGLGRPQTAPVKRIAIFQRKLHEAGVDRFWSKSFAVDPWSATRELLSWRDELVEAGWKPGTGHTRSRLADLAIAETSGPQLPPGQADRLRAAIDALGERPAVRLSSITLVDDRTLLPIGWRTLLDALERCGVRIEQVQQPDAPALDDGRLALLSADTEIVASEALAAWLAADSADNKGLVFVLGKETSLLDHALAKAGLPCLGASSQSPHRALLQVLPLAFALAWDPPDPNRMLDFLLLPTSPLSRIAANRLAKAVVRSPGVGGDEWIKAWDEIAKTPPEEHADPKKHALRVAEWRGFVETPRYDPIKGMPRTVAKSIADRVAAWAVKRSASTSDPLFLSLAVIARELSEAIEAMESELLDRVLIERMIEQAVGVGVSDPSSTAEAAPWRSVSHPGSVWGEATTIVWWFFADTSETSAVAKWNELEKAALAEDGCPLDEPELELKRLAAAWERPLLHARERLLLVRPSLSYGAETAAHPLWHSLLARRPKIGQEILIRAETVLAQASPAFAGRVIKRAPTPLVECSQPRGEWVAPADIVRPREFAATSLEVLLTCPMQWTLANASGLTPGVRRSLPNAENLVGTVAHRIAQEIFLPGLPPEPDAVEAEAKQRFDELLPLMAATLLLPGAAGELAAARRSVPPALAELAQFLRSENLTVVGVEREFAGDGAFGDGTVINGRVDLLAAAASGRRVVIDLKWYRTDKYVRDNLKDGTAFQIAVYARLVTGEAADAVAGYFMLRQKRFLSCTPLDGGLTTLVSGPSPKETWENIRASFKRTVGEMKAGRIRATFEHKDEKQTEFADPCLLAPPNCRFCDFGGICGDYS
jgi:hypothetical protein